MEYNDLTEEQKAKALACKSTEELLELAKTEGYELSDEEIAGISGGVSWSCISDCPQHVPCPQDR